MSRLISAFEQIRRHPLDGTARLLRGNLCHRSGCFRLRIDLKSRTAENAPPVRAIHCEPGNLDRLGRLRSDPASGILPSAFFEDRAHGLQRFYLGFIGERLAHITWLAGPGEATTVSGWTPGPGALEFRDVCTLPHARRKGVFAQVACHILADLAREGFHTAYSHVDIHNTASLRAFESLGFVRESNIATLRILGFDLHRDRPLIPIVATPPVPS